MNYTGHWITGSKGAKRTIALSRELNRQDMEHAKSQFTGITPRYRPWMSCHKRLKYFAANDFAGIPPENTSWRMFNTDTLQFLSQAFQAGPNLPMGYLEITEDSGMCVEIQDWERVEKTRRLTDAALNWIICLDESYAARIGELIQEVIPLGLSTIIETRRKEGRGLSSHFYRGGIFVDLPEIEQQLEFEYAINLVHEMGHQALIVYQNADSIILGDLRQSVYSAIRNAHRPAIKSFHAIVALAFMKEFIMKVSRHRQASKISHSHLLQKERQINSKLSNGIEAFQESGIKLTDVGSAIFEECKGVHDVTP